jgi:hypothetical protein
MDTRHPGHRSRNESVGISRRTALQGAALAGASLALLAAKRSLVAPARAAQTGPPPEWLTKDATKHLHGQLILGEGPVYLSHLPMFMFDPPEFHPHHYQVIVEATFPEEAMEAYLADRAGVENPFYTFRPTTLIPMLDIIALALNGGPGELIVGDIIRGHWERGGEPQPFGIEWDEVHEGTAATVERVIYAHEFAFEPPPQEILEYVLFGAGDQLFLAHRITAPPDFDQVLPVTMESGAFSDEQLRAGIILAIPERENTIAARLMEGDEATANARQSGTGVALAAELPISAGRELFFEETELRENGFLGHSEIEIEAGFGFPE